MLLHFLVTKYVDVVQSGQTVSNRLRNWFENAVVLYSRNDLARKRRRSRHKLMVSQAALRTTKYFSLCAIGQAYTRVVTKIANWRLLTRHRHAISSRETLARYLWASQQRMRSQKIFDKAFQTGKCFKRLNFVQILTKKIMHDSTCSNINVQTGKCFVTKQWLKVLDRQTFPIFGHCFSALFSQMRFFWFFTYTLVPEYDWN